MRKIRELVLKANMFNNGVSIPDTFILNKPINPGILSAIPMKRMNGQPIDPDEIRCCVEYIKFYPGGSKFAKQYSTTDGCYVIVFTDMDGDTENGPIYTLVLMEDVIAGVLLSGRCKF